MKKQLPTDGIANELTGSSVFFHRPTAAQRSSPAPAADKAEIQNEEPHPETMAAPHHATMPPRHRDTTAADNHGIDPSVHGPAETTDGVDTAPAASALLAQVRKAVKQVGKEAATHRFTAAEKQALVELVYTYGRRGLKTSENEITRIAVNWLLLDYGRQGADSVLARLLDSLHG